MNLLQTGIPRKPLKIKDLPPGNKGGYPPRNEGGDELLCIQNRRDPIKMEQDLRSKWNTRGQPSCYTLARWDELCLLKDLLGR